MIKLIYLIVLVFVGIYFFRVFKMLFMARRNLNNLRSNLKKKAEQKAEDSNENTVTLSPDDYKVESKD